MVSNQVFIVAAARTPIGSFGGVFQNVSPVTLGVAALTEAVNRAKLSERKELIDDVYIGNVLGAGHGMNIARQVARGAGIPVETPATTVNMVCGSGLKAITLGVSAIQNGEASLVAAGGVESMSMTPYLSRSHRWGARMGESPLIDLMLHDGLTDAFGLCHMGITAENIAKKLAISRERQDEFAAESQRRAAHAIEQGWFRDEIVPVEISQKKETVRVERDEYPRPGTTVSTLSKLRPAFNPDGTVTAGNASGINDGAAMLILASERIVASLGLTPLASITGAAAAGVDPSVMGLGPVSAVRKLVKKTGVSLNAVDVIESNEAFAVQSLAVQQELELNPSIVNEWGGAIALGHPIGASGARIVVTLLSRMKRDSRRRGLATLCVGGGQGIALLVHTA